MNAKPQAAVFVAVIVVSSLIAGLGMLVGGRARIAQARAPQTEMNDVEKIDEDRGDDECRVGSQFPDTIRRWCKTIDQAALATGIESGLIAAVMLEESGGDPQAISQSGAVGLLQVMPRDGPSASFQCPNGPCFANRPSTDELLDPQFNINYGARMLAGLWKQSDDLREALFRYGPMDVGYTYADTVLAILQNYQ